MSRFNTNKPTSKTTNLAGGEAYKQSSKFEIVSVLLTSFVQDQFYRKAEDGLKRFKELIQSEPNKEFIAKAALYARNVFGMRSISHVAAAELAHLVRGESWTRPFYANVIRRPDDATEILSYYLTTYGKPIPEALKHGIAQGLSKFSAYQLAKYRGEGKGLKLRDVVNLVHVRPNANNEEAFKDLMNGNLKSFDTWETKLTLAGSDADQKKVA